MYKFKTVFSFSTPLFEIIYCVNIIVNIFSNYSFFKNYECCISLKNEVTGN